MGAGDGPCVRVRNVGARPYFMRVAQNFRLVCVDADDPASLPPNLSLHRIQSREVVDKNL